MVWLLHTVSLRGVCLTDYLGLWSFNFLPQFRGIAPPGNVVLFNIWMVFTSAAQWMIVSWVLRLLTRMIRQRFRR
jgi:hypothetical protein